MLNPPQTDKYKAIKDKLISVLSESNDKKIKKLMSDITLGDMKPSQLLNEMRRLGDTAVPPESLKTLWLQRLPPHVQSILATSGDSLENLAVMADKITDIEQPQIAAVTQVSPSTTLLLQTLIKEIEEIKINQRSFHQTPNQFRPPSRSREPSR